MSEVSWEIRSRPRTDDEAVEMNGVVSGKQDNVKNGNVEERPLLGHANWAGDLHVFKCW